MVFGGRSGQNVCMNFTHLTPQDLKSRINAHDAGFSEVEEGDVVELVDSHGGAPPAGAGGDGSSSGRDEDHNDADDTITRQSAPKRLGQVFSIRTGVQY